VEAVLGVGTRSRSNEVMGKAPILRLWKSLQDSDCLRGQAINWNQVAPKLRTSSAVGKSRGGVINQPPASYSGVVAQIAEARGLGTSGRSFSSWNLQRVHSANF